MPCLGQHRDVVLLCVQCVVPECECSIHDSCSSVAAEWCAVAVALMEEEEGEDGLVSPAVPLIGVWDVLGDAVGVAVEEHQRTVCALGGVEGALAEDLARHAAQTRAPDAQTLHLAHEPLLAHARRPQPRALGPPPRTVDPAQRTRRPRRLLRLALPRHVRDAHDLRALRPHAKVLEPGTPRKRPQERDRRGRERVSHALSVLRRAAHDGMHAARRDVARGALHDERDGARPERGRDLRTRAPDVVRGDARRARDAALEHVRVRRGAHDGAERRARRRVGDAEHRDARVDGRAPRAPVRAERGTRAAAPRGAARAQRVRGGEGAREGAREGAGHELKVARAVGRAARVGRRVRVREAEHDRVRAGAVRGGGDARAERGRERDGEAEAVDADEHRARGRGAGGVRCLEDARLCAQRVEHRVRDRVCERAADQRHVKGRRDVHVHKTARCLGLCHCVTGEVNGKNAPNPKGNSDSFFFLFWNE